MKRYTVIESLTLPRTQEQADILSALTDIRNRLATVSVGQLPHETPELGNTKPEYFGITLVTKEGHVFDVGDYDIPFTLQTLTHPFLFASALDDWGRDLVLNYVDVQQSDNGFPAFRHIESQGYLPENPLLRCGALAMASLVDGDNPTERLNRLIDRYNQFVGHKVHVDISTFMSLRLRGHQIRALGYLLVNAGLLDVNRLDEVLDLYFQQSSVLVTGHDLAVMAATVANQGVNPLTGRRVMHQSYVKDLLSVMAVNGMGAHSGTWLYEVGIPTAVSNSGAMMAVVPNKFGIAIYSPLLDEDGVSVRGRMVLEELSKRFDCHCFNGMAPTSSMETLLKPKSGSVPSEMPEDLNGELLDRDPVIIPLLENDLMANP